MSRKIVALFNRRYSPARSRSRIGERIYPKAVGRDGITMESPFFVTSTRSHSDCPNRTIGIEIRA
jgi:hypothetical protein